MKPWFQELDAINAAYCAGIERIIQNARATMNGHEWLQFLEACSDRFNSLATDWEQHDDDAFPTLDNPADEPGEPGEPGEDFIVLCDRCAARLEAAEGG